MKAKKKGKDIVMELVGDLLGEADQPKKAPGAGIPKLEPKARAARPQSNLAQSEHLRLAQQKILDLENEMDRLREENEALGAAGQTMRERAEGLMSKAERFERKYMDTKESADQEKEILMESLKAKDAQVQDLLLKIDELEARLSSNIRKVRVRERELENRLELVKLENASMVQSKDEIILDLKRQMDQLSHELENFRLKGQKISGVLDQKQEVLSRTVKALRLALAMLEGSDADEALKRVD